jgi:hypothetical protein
LFSTWLLHSIENTTLQFHQVNINVDHWEWFSTFA